ncbi:hypothetical protein Bca52824_045736 [Brassica carinata]|uniref:F-box domain-containing protein n=2 Tax=Brassica TaxID=3705 RepID=A0A8X7RDR6_BRACI|nr:hypothetical protein Bca52824_045736 [Brassica carinata]VDD13496.1 unnamed protein product [Brassica oleracea]
MARKSSGVINIPLDLMVEILEKLPTKSLARFRCVSYQWESMINKFIVIDSIMTRRLNQPPRDPHFLFKRHWFQPRLDHIPHTILSYTYLYHQVTDEQQLYHEEIIEKEEGYLMGFQYARGLIGFCCSRNDQFRIHNLTTRQSLFLPVTRLPGSLFYLFGYDTFKNQYKVLCQTQNQHGMPWKLFILGDVSKEDIQCSIGVHFLFEQAICINGEIYYIARNANCTHVLVSFDVRHEKFSYVQTPGNLLAYHHHEDLTIVNYHGKLGCICRNKVDVDMWVMQDAKKQEWSKITFLDMLQSLPKLNTRFAGVANPGGEIVIVHQPHLIIELALNVYYYDTKQNGLRRSEIQTTSPSDLVSIRAVMDHVENIMRL